MPCAEWYTSVGSRRLSTVELKAFLAVDSGACLLVATATTCRPTCDRATCLCSDEAVVYAASR
eukprot:9077072-Pyramimonas_sp.AAC.1